MEPIPPGVHGPAVPNDPPSNDQHFLHSPNCAVIDPEPEISHLEADIMNVTGAHESIVLNNLPSHDQFFLFGPNRIIVNPADEIPHLEYGDGQIPFILPSTTKFQLEVATLSYAWIQCVGLHTQTEDLLVSGIHQHLHPVTNEIFFLPFVVAAWLLANRPTEWQVQSVVPLSITPAVNPGTGLDTMNAATTAPWGVDKDTGTPYFDTQGNQDSGETAYLSVESGVIWLTQEIVNTPIPSVEVSIQYAWIQCTKARSQAADLLAAGYHQHMHPVVNGIFFLPFAVASWLLANKPTDWQVQSVVPRTITPAIDGGTGLDTMSAMTTAPWGLSSTAHSAYFDTQGNQNTNEVAYLSLESGKAWLNQ